MQKRKIYFLLFILLFAFDKFSFAQLSFNPAYLDQIIKSEKNSAQLKQAEKESSFTDDYDLVYMRSEWQIDPKVYYIKGDITFYIKPLFDDLIQLFFDLSDSLQVNSFTFHGTTSTNFARPGNNTVALHLPNTIAIGTVDSVTVSYEGKPSGSGFGSFTQSSHNGDSVIYTLSEPYGASDWFPCKNSLTDKMDSMDIIVQMPSDDRVGTNGVVVEDYYPDDSTHVMHWRTRYPIATYLVGIAVTNYAEFVEYAPLSSGDTVKVVEYVYEEQAAEYAANPGAIVDLLQLFSDLFGDYPFKEEKYGHAQWNWGGGEEHQTMSFVTFPNIFELISHELGHQWFGDKITCGSWQDIWLNEGFATYLAGLSYEHLGPEYWYPYKELNLNRALRDSTGSVFCDDTSNVSRIFSGSLTYSKGMYLLHMLRWKLGDEDFFQGVSDYINDPDLCYGFARTEDLKQHLVDASGTNLDEFLADWFYGKGYPAYHIKWSNNSDGTMNIAVHQTQNNPSVSFFEMPLPVQLKDATHDIVVRLENLYNDQNFVVGPFDFVPDTLKFDPDLWIASTRNTVAYDSLLSNPILVFPNPAGDQLHISYHDVDAATEIFIYDLSGKELKYALVNKLSFYDPLVIDVSNFAAGVYLLELKTTGVARVEKFVKQ